MFCFTSRNTADDAGCRVVTHNFRYRVHPCSMSIIYPLLCFFNVIYAPSCNRCVLITPVPGIRAPCTLQSPFTSLIEPRGMHNKVPPPLPLAPFHNLSHPPARSLPRPPPAPRAGAGRLPAPRAGAGRLPALFPCMPCLISELTQKSTKTKRRRSVTRNQH